MKVVRDMQEWRALRKTLVGSVGFVPTMGALHQGHGSLLQRSVAEEQITVLSIYVNPTQFNDAKDLAAYPDTLEDDLQLAEQLGVDFVILPRYEDVYADGFRFQVEENQLSRGLCGADRPGHFTGVLTIVMKLLNLVAPDRAYFGKKDFQQYTLIKDMCETFFMNVEIVGCQTVRELDGLAMSSRNKLLDAETRSRVAVFYDVLTSASSDRAAILALENFGFKVDYVETIGQRRFGAIVVGLDSEKVRLIDNVVIETARGPGRSLFQGEKNTTTVSAG